LDQLPTTFGKYQILERVAVGSMAEIYKAHIEGLAGFHRAFAIKRILPHLAGRSELVEMLVEEAKIAGLLSHANIVQILDLGQVGETYYIAMEYIEGPDLGRILARCRARGLTLPVPHAVFIAIEVLKGLEYAHNRQVSRGGSLVPLDIVHRDVSPGNVLVSFLGAVKLTDFGIAKATVKDLSTVTTAARRFDYMSPEQAAGQETDHRTDLFNVGVLLYEMLTSRHPFSRSSEAATAVALSAGRAPPASQLNPDIPYQLEGILNRALRPSPGDRFQSATEFKDSLDHFFHDAGFIFSHSTLAAFLEGLFAEPTAAEGPVTRPFGGEGDDRPTVAPGPVPNPATFDTTVRSKKKPLQLPRSPLELPELPAGPGLSPPSDFEDAQTLIRAPKRAESEWNANSVTQIKAPKRRPSPDPNAFSDHDPTRLRPAPRAAEPRTLTPTPATADRATPQPAAVQSAALPGPAPLRTGHPGPGRPAAAPPAAAPPTAAPPTAALPTAALPAAKPTAKPTAALPAAQPTTAQPRRQPAARRPQPPRRRTQRSIAGLLLYLVLSAMLAAMVLLVGFLLGLRLAALPAFQELLHRGDPPPMVTVTVESGATASLGDSALSGTQTLPLSGEQTLELTGTATLSFDDGQLTEISVSTQTEGKE